MNPVRLRLFGAFRDYSENPVLEFELDEAVTVERFRGLLLDRLCALKGSPQTAALVADSAIADEESTLDEQDWIQGGRELAILPPVCGG